MSKHPPETDSPAIAIKVAATLTSLTNTKVEDYDASLKMLGIDSMTMLDLLAILETTFDINLNENIVKEFDSINKISRIINEIIKVTVR